MTCHFQVALQLVAQWHMNIITVALSSPLHSIYTTCNRLAFALNCIGWHVMTVRRLNESLHKLRGSKQIKPANDGNCAVVIA
jgi:hypothetical protein